MKKLLVTSLAILGTCAFVTAASATSCTPSYPTDTGEGSCVEGVVTYTDLMEWDDLKIGTKSDPVVWEVDITQYGFNPDTQDVLSGLLTLYFHDDDPDDNPYTEYAQFSHTYYLNSGTWLSIANELNPPSTLPLNIGNVSYLQDGHTIFQLEMTKGDIYLDAAQTVLNATCPVPEPTTMLLFGTGILGLAGVARRKKQ